jgi:hypothetical protein
VAEGDGQRGSAGASLVGGSGDPPLALAVDAAVLHIA